MPGQLARMTWPGVQDCCLHSIIRACRPDVKGVAVMAANAKPVAHTGGMGLFIIGTVFYLSFIGLFLWQTAEFVNWLFPDDQVLYRIITVCVFDVMALLWACIDTFYRFATRGSHQLVKWAWGVSFIAAMIASVFYMVLQSMTRLDFTPDIAWIDTGFGIVILVTVLQILFLTFWIRMEWMTRHPRMNDYEYDSAPIIVESVPEQAKVLTRPAPARKSIDTRPVKQLPRARKFTPTGAMEAVILSEKKEVAVPAPAPFVAPETEKMVAVKPG